LDKILIRGARTHNLKNIDLTLPRDKLIVITGLSGSGKSSLAFDTLYAEGQRRYVESLSAYARQFLSMMEKPDVDTIEGLSPAISIEQKSTSHNPRSTVGTITEIYDYLRLLYARVGTPRCPDHDIPLEAQTVSQMVDLVLAQPEGSKLMLLAPVIRERKGEHLSVFEELRAQGFVRAGQRQALRAGRAAQAGQAEEALHRCGGRPLQGPRRPAAAPGRIVRDRAEAGGRHRPGRADGR
jgi:excinuclease ABC subunit A